MVLAEEVVQYVVLPRSIKLTDEDVIGAVTKITIQ